MAVNFFGKGAADFGLAGKYAAQLNAPAAAAAPFNRLQYYQGLPKDMPEESKLKFLALAEEENSPSSQLLKTLLPAAAKSAEQAAWMSSPEGIEYLSKKSQELSRERSKQGLLFNTLAKIPETMAAAISPFGGPVGAAMAYQGMSAIPGVYAQTMAAYPGIQVPGYSAQQYRYFQ